VCVGSFLKPLDSFAMERSLVEAMMESRRRPRTSVRFSVAWDLSESWGPGPGVADMMWAAPTRFDYTPGAPTWRISIETPKLKLGWLASQRSAQAS
jgi:hypothetical protein